ncbi:hypothetical protein [Butyrivibrio sp. M55]|uniref:hypothetical protein n=1 Tax=Butyrivibrio sp. M55 TaxID=1855323 RepID=UPI0008E30645|nr:hypothetical protein [Butyrivibrio sp. M55]SFU79007.1 hypothetical protein SAMN05216540_11036 [Butyrivibrio sp. M55]
MVLVTVLMIIAWELMVIMFAYIYHVIPLKKHSENNPKILLPLSACSVIAGLVALFYVKTNYSSGIFNASYWNEANIRIFMFIPFLWFAMVLFGLFYRKSHVLPKEETIFLKAEEYKIVKDFDLLMGDYMYMPNVKSYCEFRGGKILFSISAPEHEVDCAFTCRMVKEGIYECMSYEIVNKDIRVKIVQIMNIVFCILIAVDLALAMLWLSQAPELNIDLIGRVISSLSISLFGIAGLKLYKGAKGIMAKFMLGFSIMLIILGIAKFFK